MNETQPTELARFVKQEAKRKGLVAIKSKWEQQPLHGQYALRSKDADIDQLNTHQWLRCAGLKAETEGFIMAAQDQSLFTRNYLANIIRNGTDSRCKLCLCKTIVLYTIHFLILLLLLVWYDSVPVGCWGACDHNSVLSLNPRNADLRLIADESYLYSYTLCFFHIHFHFLRP